MANEKKWEELFGVPRRKPESEISQIYMDMALAIQQVTEEAVLLLARAAKELTGSKNLVLAGGVRLGFLGHQHVEGQLGQRARRYDQQMLVLDEVLDLAEQGFVQFIGGRGIKAS